MWDNIEFTTWNVPFWRWSKLAAKYLDQDPQKIVLLIDICILYMSTHMYVSGLYANSCTEYNIYIIYMHNTVAKQYTES